MNKLIKLVSIGAIAVGLSACGDRVEVPPAMVGKIMGHR